MPFVARSLVIAALGGCLGACAPAGTTSASGPTAGSVIAPAAVESAGAAPTPDAAPAASPTPSASKAPPVAQPAECVGDGETGAQALGTAAHGVFKDKPLPKGWTDAYHTELEVYRALDYKYRTYRADWPCFKLRFPAAAAQYEARMGI